MYSDDEGLAVLRMGNVDQDYKSLRDLLEHLEDVKGVEGVYLISLEGSQSVKVYAPVYTGDEYEDWFFLDQWGEIQRI